MAVQQGGRFAPAVRWKCYKVGGSGWWQVGGAGAAAGGGIANAGMVCAGVRAVVAQQNAKPGGRWQA